ncbi:MAG: rRNA (uracil1498-N3)-methyltransferase [Candidatus Dependentiae bacterium]|nr:rRNA (uracil1498-N3)-methyltransferase [Candidatus Dependentiae bacterium]
MVQLFSAEQVLTIELTPSARSKDTICGTVTAIEKIEKPTHTIVAAIGLLKKESFEEAVHHATVTGATHIVPLITTKSRKNWLHERELERLQGVIIAACEQSKNRHIPTLFDPKVLSAATTLWPHAYTIGFEADCGHPISTLIEDLSAKKPAETKIFIGPEGGFTTEELTLLGTHKIKLYELTQTVLRSQEAVCLAIGIVSATLR